MSKEKKQEAALEINNVKDLDKQLAEALKNSKNKPTDEEIEAAKKEFIEKSSGFDNKLWEIGKQEESQVNIDYIEHYVKNRIFWTQNGWMGVIKMEEVIAETQNTLKMEPKAHLAFSYQPLEFMFYSLQNAGGLGSQSAKDFESENEIYAKVFDAIGEKVAEARKELKEIQFLQDKYAAMAQGFYLEVEDGVETDPGPQDPEKDPEKDPENIVAE
jgi:hypothetical protein